MFGNLIALAGGYLALGEEHADRIHAQVWTAVITAMLVIAVMFGLNLIGLEAVNYIVLLAGLLSIGMSFTSPRALALAGSVGGAVAFLGDKDVSQGIVGGWKLLAVVMGTTMFVFTASAGLLSIVSFRENAGAFPPIVTVLVGLGLCYGITKNKGLRSLMLMIAVIVIAYNGWKVTPSDWKPTFSSSVSTPAAAQQPQAPARLMVWNARVNADGEEIPAVYSATEYSFVAKSDEPVVLRGRAGFCLRSWTDRNDLKSVNKIYWGVSRAAGSIDAEEYDRRVAAKEKLPFVEVFETHVTAVDKPITVYYEYIYGRCPK